MIYEHPLNCVCGKLPELGRKNISDTSNPNNYYYYYSCSHCDIATFGTREESCARELWNATITLRTEKLKK